MIKISQEMQTVITIEDFINQHDIDIHDISFLPLCHTTPHNIVADEIIPDGRLIAKKKIKGYEKETICFFYGKAQYASEDDIVDFYKKYPPITFIFTKERIKNRITRLVCFDSGAYENNRYGKDMPARKNFEIDEPSDTIIKKYIALFYGNNEAYIHRKFKNNINTNNHPHCYAVKELIRMDNAIRKREGAEFGEQAFTTELQIENCDIDLNPDVVFVPKSQLSSEAAQKQWQGPFASSKIEPYEDFDTDSQMMIYTRMRDAIKQYIIKNYCK